jgi:hypothetical protein
MNPFHDNASANGRERILAVDVRPRWFGFAVFGAPTQLLDFGVVGIASVARGETCLIRLVKTYWPRLVVVRKTFPRARRHRPGVRAYSRLIPRLSRRFSIQVERLSDRQLRQYFKSQGVRNKDEAAAFLARQFPALSWRVPPPRKRWQHEHKNMPIFDAVALGMAHSQSKNSARA